MLWMGGTGQAQNNGGKQMPWWSLLIQPQQSLSRRHQGEARAGPHLFSIIDSWEINQQDGKKLEIDVSPLKCSCVQTNCYCVLFTLLQRYMDRKQWVKGFKAFPFQTLSFRFTCSWCDGSSSKNVFMHFVSREKKHQRKGSGSCAGSLWWGNIFSSAWFKIWLFTPVCSKKRGMNT